MNWWRRAPARSRRNTVTRDDLPGIAAAALATAIVATLAGCHPTGNLVGDALVTGAGAGAVAWVASTASWWSLVAGGGIATVAGAAPAPVLFGLAAAAVGLWLGDRRLSMPWLRSAGAGLAVQGLLRLEYDPFFTASALIAVVGLGVLAGVAIRRRRRHQRRRILLGGLIGLGVAVLFAAGFGGAALAARGDVEDGYQGLLDGLEQLQGGDPVTAAATLRLAAGHLASADSSLGALWAQPARLVPVVAQHQQAMDSVLGQAATSARAAAAALDLVDFDQLTIDGGRIDTTAIALLERPLADLEHAVTALRTALDDADSPWLVGPLADRLARYRDRAAETERQARTIHAAAADGPAMLGADGTRRYFVGFASPAEGRALMGVMGNYAILEITDGQIVRTDFGRINDLRNELKANGPFTLEASDEFYRRYATYGAGTADRPANSTFWSNVTMTPDMGSAGPLLAQLWEATRGTTVDGVILADPAALAGLLAATGPIRVEGLDQALSATNVEQFLLLDQYALDTPERSDLLEAVAEATLQAVLDGTLPPPQRLAQDLGPAAADGDLLVWARRPQENALMRLIGVDGTLPALDGRDGLAVVTNNAVANKIDSFLERRVNYQASYDPATGRTTGTVTVTLTNTAPASGYPSYVIGSEFVDVPSGTNRTLLSVYTALAPVHATVDGVDTGLALTTELGWNVVTFELDLGPGETITVVLDVDGVLDDDGYELVLRPQPMVTHDAVEVEVDGGTVWAGELTRRIVVTGRAATALR